MADKFLGFLGDLVEPATGGGGNYVYFSGDVYDFMSVIGGGKCG